ncbi:MAG: LytTR family DNA-binding domain-containing protein [Prevotellaceae bacterium]|jgi:hypothetical protein|nr:LytTR family DNA-binding domain-containing protein [Prevotellaceae bacterium]
MGVADQKLPAYIYEKNNTIRLVLFTALFALIFINLYKPFSSFSWYQVSEFKFLVFSSMIILTGMLVVAISRIILYYWGKKRSISPGQYTIWMLLELLFMSLFYTIYTIYLNPDRDYLYVFRESLINTTLVLLLPYIALHFYFSYKDKDRRLRQFEEEKRESTSRQNSYTFYDEGGELRLSVAKSNLLYLESADNYVNIWYIHKNTLAKLMLRSSLKSIEKSMSNTNVIRCHRSYMVNLEEVKVVRRQKNGIYMEFGIDNVTEIPVSEKYDTKVSRWFSSNAS